MRHIHKSTQVPQKLQTAPIPNSEQEVSASIYKAPEVKKQLLEDQYYKCAYCEKMLEGPYDDVEHYRPKSLYFWLGHDWNNLLFACDICNRSLKSTHFPLLDESTRHLDTQDISEEVPLIINPATENPKDFIEYHEHIVRPCLVDGHESPKGRYTIDLFKLNERPQIVAQRRALYEEYQDNLFKLESAEKLLPHVKGTDFELVEKIIMTCKKAIQRMKAPETPFSGMLAD